MLYTFKDTNMYIKCIKTYIGMINTWDSGYLWKARRRGRGVGKSS